MNWNDFWYKPGGGLKVWQRILVTEGVLLLPTILFIKMYLDNSDLATLELLSAVYVFMYSIFFPWIFYEKINEKYGVLSKIRSIATYQYTSIIGSIYLFAFMYVILVCSHILDYYLGFILSSFFIIPILSSFLGTKVFNDSSCYDGDDIILGYPPVYPWISLLIGICSFFYIMKFNNSLMPIVCLTFIIQLIVVLPNITNKILPFEIRTKKGCIYFITLAIILYILLMYLTLGNEILNLPKVSLTPTQIITKIIHYASAAILAYLFYKQAKKMNNKK